MPTQWLKLIRQARDESIGAAVVRLAGLAAAAERYEQARLKGSSASAPNATFQRTTTGRGVNAVRREVNR